MIHYLWHRFLDGGPFAWWRERQIAAEFEWKFREMIREIAKDYAWILDRHRMLEREYPRCREVGEWDEAMKDFRKCRGLLTRKVTYE